MSESPDKAPTEGEAVPDNADLQEPSTEKDPGREPKAPDRKEPEPSHEAVGIGVVDEPER